MTTAVRKAVKAAIPIASTSPLDPLVDAIAERVAARVAEMLDQKRQAADEWFPPVEFRRRHASTFRSLHQLRWLLRDRDRNGLIESGAVRCLGRRVLVHEGRFLAWLDERGEP